MAKIRRVEGRSAYICVCGVASYGSHSGDGKGPKKRVIKIFASYFKIGRMMNRTENILEKSFICLVDLVLISSSQPFILQPNFAMLLCDSSSK